MINCESFDQKFSLQYFVTLVFDCKMKTDKVTDVLESVVKKLLNSFLTADGATYFHAPCYILRRGEAYGL